MRFHDILHILETLESLQEKEAFLMDILTESEVEELIKRWEIVSLLAQGVPQRDVKERVGVSISTVTRGAEQLKHGFGGFQKALGSIKNTPNDTSSNIESIRNEIDSIDTQIIDLLSRRFALMPAVAEYKKKKKRNLTDQQREDDLLQQKRSLARRKKIPEDLIQRLFVEVMEYSKRSQLEEFLSHSLDEITRMAKKNPQSKIPIALEIHSDTETPISVFSKLIQSETTGFLFESVGQDAQFSRYSFMGTNPRTSYTFYPDKTCQISGNHHNERVPYTDPFALLQTEAVKENVLDTLDFLRFSGGFVGFFGYEMVENIEHIDFSHQEKSIVEIDGFFAIYERMMVFDHQQGKLFATYLIDAEDVAASYQSALDYFQQRMYQLETPHTQISIPEISISEDEVISQFERNFSEEEYMNLVIKLKKDIYNGEVFQIVPSQKFQTSYSGDPFIVYRYLRKINPSPYLFFLKTPHVSLAGASPETFVQVEKRKISFAPLAGTYPRSNDPKIDQERQQELPHNIKERAEHMMLVDLGRNDLGKVSKPGSIEVTELAQVHLYSRVMHLASRVEGILRETLHPLDAWRAVFPRGTLTGAPKIRAIELIARGETHRRGPYGGGVGYIDFHGNLDAAICIRTVVMAQDKAETQAGAGVVMDSDPEKEHAETIHKSYPQLLAIVQAKQSQSL